MLIYDLVLSTCRYQKKIQKKKVHYYNKVFAWLMVKMNLNTNHRAMKIEKKNVTVNFVLI